jgi:beta-lactamase regulating signal transducer with metallopeptidase domain
MVNLFHYLTNVSICIGAFYLFYYIFLKKITLFTANRIYLVGSVLAALLIPFIDINLFVSTNVVNIQSLSEIPINSFLPEDYSGAAELKTKFTLVQLLTYLYFGGIVFFLTRFFIYLFKILRYIIRYQKIKINRLTFVLADKESMVFSFFHYIFIKECRLLDPAITPIIEHEKVHARQMHSLDLIFAELVTAFLWFNPFVFFFRNSIKANHEYLADSKVVRSGFDPLEYLVTLAKEVFNKHLFGLTSNFNYSLTKKRLLMITRINSKKITALRFLLIIPVFVVLILACSKSLEEKPKLSIDSIKLNEKSQSSDIPSIMPIDKDKIEMVSGYGWRIHPTYKIRAFHRGIDLKAPKGTQVYSSASGVVEYTNTQNKSKAKGFYIRIRHNSEYETEYTHLSKTSVKKGDEVKPGQIIGYVGSTGLSTAPHLHYEVIKNGKNADPKDYLGTTISKIKTAH